MAQTSYEFFHDRPGLFLEIYLPKKAQYQPLLFRVLNEGFDLSIVRGHFRSAKAKDIRRFLRRKQELMSFSLPEIRSFQSVFRDIRCTRLTARLKETFRNTPKLRAGLNIEF